jgi:uncharacterized protein with GYD domain
MKWIFSVVVAAFLASPVLADSHDETRHFLFVGTPNAAAWKFMIDTPGDREASVRGPIEALGGELIAYFWGLGNSKNYILVALPDDPSFIQAFYLTRLGDGLLDEYQMIELMNSADMAEALSRVSEVKEFDDMQK